MRIGIDASRANVANRTGTERYSYEVIRRLVRQHPGDQFLLYLREQPLPELANLGPRVRLRVLRWPFHGLWNLVRLSLALVVDRPDVLFVPAHTIPLLHPKKTVTTLHDVGFERWHSLYSKKLIRSTGVFSQVINTVVKIFSLGRYSATELDYHRWSARFAVRTAAHIITISEFSKQEITSLYHVDPSRLTVIALGYGDSYLAPIEESTAQTTLQRLGVSQPYLYFIGRLEEKKNIRRMLEAFVQLAQSGRPHHFVLAGAPGLGFAEALATVPPELRARIHTLGWVDEKDAHVLLQNAAVFFFPSLYEGFGIPILESFVTGTPVITSNTGATAEVGGDAVLGVDPHDTKAMVAALQRLIDDPKLQAALIARGKQRAQLFNWDECARQTYAVLSAVATESSTLPRSH